MIWPQNWRLDQKLRRLHSDLDIFLFTIIIDLLLTFFFPRMHELLFLRKSCIIWHLFNDYKNHNLHKKCPYSRQHLSVFSFARLSIRKQISIQLSKRISNNQSSKKRKLSHKLNNNLKIPSLPGSSNLIEKMHIFIGIRLLRLGGFFST